MPNSFKVDDILFEDNEAIANVFNDYFIESNIFVDEIDVSINEHEFNYNLTHTIPVHVYETQGADIFEFEIVSQDTVMKLLSNLDTNKSVGLDGIGASFLRNAKEEISSNLTKLINMSLNSGIYPIDWKSAMVKPLFKKGDMQSIINYRPISVLPVVSKIIEKIVHKQLYDYLSSHKVLNDSQFGFRPGHSTSSALGSMTDNWLRAIDDGQIIGSIFIDLRRAFDTVDTKLLLIKLHKISCSEITIKWFDSYLNNRIQRVAVRDSLSNERPLSLGVPQGSIL